MPTGETARRFATHAAALGAVRAMEAAGFSAGEMTLAELPDAERHPEAAAPGGSLLRLRTADPARLRTAAAILAAQPDPAPGEASADPRGHSAAGGSSGTVLGHALSGTGARPEGTEADLPGTAAADRARAGRG